jgi:metal-responsive CopG/Arc/MetJ family transcriptional regulator
MKAVQIMMDEKLIDLVDREARRRHSDRSKLVRRAVELFLADAERREKEARYVAGYAKRPIKPGEFWEQDRWPKS